MKAALFLLLSLACLCQAKNFTLVLLKDAMQEGAVCLDGSAAGYYIRKGSGSGADKWILHLEGGGWCVNETNCYDRSKTMLGSSKMWPASVAIGGFLSDNSTVNPDFYNWNIVYLMYCDGGSFAGSVKDPIHVNGKPIYFRGQQILKSDLDDLLASGMKSASEIILTGCSAGGLATYLHADSVGAYLPQNIKFRAIADAGYFLDIKALSGVFLFQEYGRYVYQIQNMSGGVNQNCLEAHLDNEEWRCFLAPYTYPYIKTPIFVLNSLYDTAQLKANQLGCLPPNCSQKQMEFFDNFRVEFLSQATPAIISTSNGFFGDSCLVHCQTLTDDTWSVYKVSGQLMSETFANWYFGRNGKTRVLDCAYPCNPTCPGVHPLAEELHPSTVGERLFYGTGLL